MTQPSTPSAAVDLNAPEIVAVVSDRVARETAELRTRAETAESERDAALTKIDVLEAEKVAAVQAKETAEAEVASLKETVANEQASATRRDSRKAALREVAAHLTDEWFAAEVAQGDSKLPRLEKIARMTDDEFDTYKGELAAAFEGVTVAPAAGNRNTSGGNPPRETAMAGTSTGGTGSTERASSRWIGGISLSGRR